VAVALALAGPAGACEVALGLGKTAPANAAHSTGTVDLGCRWGRFELGYTYINEALVDEKAPVPRMHLLHLSRVWALTPRLEAYTGLVIKQDESGRNDKLPLPIGFHLGLGYNIGEWRVAVLHDSNNNLDGGGNRANQGINWLRIQWVHK
jgi:hypothetical protein